MASPSKLKIDRSDCCQNLPEHSHGTSIEPFWTKFWNLRNLEPQRILKKLKKVDFTKISYFYSSQSRWYFLITLFGLFFWKKCYIIRWPWPTFSRSNGPFSKQYLNMNISHTALCTGSKFCRVLACVKRHTAEKKNYSISWRVLPRVENLKMLGARLSRD